MAKIDKSKLSKEELHMLEVSEYNTEQSKKLQSLIKETEKLNQTVADAATRQAVTQMLGVIQASVGAPAAIINQADNKPLIEAVEALGEKLNVTVEAPVINVPEPKVTVKPADVNIDLSPVTQAIKGQRLPEPLPAVATEASVIYINGKPHKLHRTPIDVTSFGATTVAEGSLQVISLFILASKDTRIVLKDTDGKMLSGYMDLDRAPGFVLPENEHGWTNGNGFVIEQNTDSNIGGLLTYIKV